MAEHLPEVRITVDDEVIQALQKASDELSEERIRAIVREELAAWQRQISLASRLRSRME